MSTKEDGIGSFSTKKSNIKNSIRSEENRPLMADYKNDLNPIIKKFNSEDRSTMVTTATTQSSSPMTTAAATVMNPTILKDQSKQIVFRTASHPVQFKPTATTIDEDFKSNRFQVDKVDRHNDDVREAKIVDDDFGDDDDDDETRSQDSFGALYGTTGAGYETKNLKSFHHYTREALPRVDHYRNAESVHGYLARPTLDELHGTQATVSFDSNTGKIIIEPAPEEIDPSKIVKFGWIKGVFVRCLLNIWGVMLFLRLSWVAAQSGIIQGTLILLLASLVTIVTTMSMSAICTNGEVKSGGTYYMISRSLGPEFGGSIGIIFSLANAVAVAMYSIGFAETVCDHLGRFGKVIFDGGLNDIRLISSITVVILFGIVLIGTEWEAQTQIVLLFILLAAISDFLIGSFIPPTDLQISQGYVGWSSSLIWENMFPDYRNESFFSVFAVYFPAATGILAGANISGDLKDPSFSIPLGTFLAIIITTITYISFHFIVAANVVRDANGVIELIHHPGVKDVVSAVRNCSLSADGLCHYGSMNNFQIIELMSWFGPVIYAGIYAATLSSALASLVSAPKVFQALCYDKLFPGISYFGKGFGPNDEPRRGYVLTLIIGLCCCLMGELNLIAPIISNFFLAAYTLINFSCFHASWSKSPGFRPSFKYFNLWIALFGSFLCLMVMFITAWISALITFIIVFALFVWVQNREPDVNWGSSTQAQIYRSAVNTVYKLTMLPEHVKTYRPQILLLSGNPSTRSEFIDLAFLMTKNIGLLICGHIVMLPISVRAQNILIHDGIQYLIQKNIKAFLNLVQESTLSQGVKSMIQSVGIGKLRPNIIMLGYKSNWHDCDANDVLEYFRTIHLIFDYHYAIVIVHIPNRKHVMNGDAKASNDKENLESTTITMRNDPNLDSSFLSKQQKGFIDVWWLYDDGGLTLLLPYIIRTHSHWKNCKLRIFALVNKKTELDAEQRNMAALLSKFRIDYSDVILITDLLKPPEQSSKDEFKKLIDKYIVKNSDEQMIDDSGDEERNPLAFKETDWIRFKDKVCALNSYFRF
ncbi:Solute carrier family 12 member 2 [Sarcoptes scabiei]|uniref:Solute carrier family 12 member 2 n=1 Tax=Sarcoptes scabiei TaxID=52283 RepID=A0A834R9P7_SARSC|nr:Solute carrier family 12 member 2 [Sarcoptes scabiei]